MLVRHSLAQMRAVSSSALLRPLQPHPRQGQATISTGYASYYCGSVRHTRPLVFSSGSFIAQQPRVYQRSLLHTLSAHRVSVPRADPDDVFANILASLPGPVSFAAAYGSGVFAQGGSQTKVVLGSS